MGFEEVGQGRSQKFLFGGPSCGNNIFIKTTPNTHICIHKFFIIIIYTHIYTHTFYLISYIYIYIYTHPKKKRSSIFNQNYV